MIHGKLMRTEGFNNKWAVYLIGASPFIGIALGLIGAIWAP